MPYEVIRLGDALWDDEEELWPYEAVEEEAEEAFLEGYPEEATEEDWGLEDDQAAEPERSSLLSIAILGTLGWLIWKGRQR